MRMTVDQAFKAAVEHPSQAAFDDLAEAIESSVQEPEPSCGCLHSHYDGVCPGSSVQEPEHMNLAPITDDDLLRIANRPGGINEQLRAAMDARDHQNRSNEGENR